MRHRHPVFFTILFLTLFCILIPVSVFYFVFASSAYSKLASLIVSLCFSNRNEYFEYYYYVINMILMPILLWFAFGSFIVFVVIAPGSKLEYLSFSQKIRRVVILGAIFLLMLYAIPFIHLGEVMSDYQYIKKGETCKIISDSYVVKTRKNLEGRYNRPLTSYYIYFNDLEGSSPKRTFSIGRDLYEYLLIHPDEEITLNYLPATGIFLNIQIGDEKFGTYVEEDALNAPDESAEPDISEDT